MKHNKLSLTTEYIIVVCALLLAALVVLCACGRAADKTKVRALIIPKFEIGETTRKRIQVMVDTTDGFEIAEQDLKLRGPGDLEGTQQSGMAFDLKIANLARDGQILTIARDTAQAVITSDPEERNPLNDVLWRRLRELRKSNINWGAIS